MKKKRVLAITLARGGSKEVKKKNIKKINNKPLIWYTIKEALKSKLIDRYIISTDNQEIKKISLKQEVGMRDFGCTLKMWIYVKEPMKIK